MAGGATDEAPARSAKSSVPFCPRNSVKDLKYGDRRDACPTYAEARMNKNSSAIHRGFIVVCHVVGMNYTMNL